MRAAGTWCWCLPQVVSVGMGGGVGVGVEGSGGAQARLPGRWCAALACLDGGARRWPAAGNAEVEGEGRVDLVEAG